MAKTDDLSKILGDAADKGGKGKLSKGKKIIIAVVALVLVAAIVIGLVLGVRAKKENDNAPVYREYTVTRGDIVVGLTESSVITLNKENITFPVGAEVLELYVKSGSQVNEGDPVAKLSTDDIADALTDYETEIESAALSLENAKLSRKTGLLKAQQTLETNLLNGELSGGEYSSAVKQAEQELESAKKSVDEAQEKYDDLVAKSKTFSSDLAKLTYYETKMNSYQELVDFYSNQKSAYNEVSQDLSKVQSEIRSIADVSDMDQYYAVVAETEEDYAEMYDRYYNGTDSESTASSVSGMGSQQSVKLSELLKAEEKLTALKDAEDEIEDLFEEETRLESKLALYDEERISDGLADAEENLTESKEDYNEFKSEFSETYGNVTDKEEMDKSVDDALTSLEKSKLSLSKQESSYQTALLNAEQKKESTDSTASNAQKEYNLQKIELDKKVSDAQEQYDNLVEELAEIKEAIGNDGVVTASCSGIVSSLNIEVGDEISAGGSSDSMGFGSSSSAATLMTITDMSEVNISISISEDDILDIYLDQEAIVEIASFPDDKFDAVVDSISVEGATIGAASVSYTVNVSFVNDAGYELYDGMSADVTLVQGSARDCLYINEQAVTTKDGKTTVLVKGADGNGVETEVVTGFSDGQYIEIISGVNEGDTVLVQSALGSGTDGKGSVPDMGDFDMSNMPDRGGFDMSNMPDMESFNPGEMMR